MSGFTECTVNIGGNTYTATTDNGKTGSGNKNTTTSFDITGATTVIFKFKWGGNDNDTRGADIILTN